MGPETHQTSRPKADLLEPWGGARGSRPQDELSAPHRAPVRVELFQGIERHAYMET